MALTKVAVQLHHIRVGELGGGERGGRRYRGERREAVQGGEEGGGTGERRGSDGNLW